MGYSAKKPNIAVPSTVMVPIGDQSRMRKRRAARSDASKPAKSSGYSSNILPFGTATSIAKLPLTGLAWMVDDRNDLGTEPRPPAYAKYFANELTKRCASENVEKLATALADAQVDVNPHQIEALKRRYSRSARLSLRVRAILPALSGLRGQV